MAKSFPDVSGDGEVTKKDVLMAKGVIPKTAAAKKGGSVVTKLQRVTTQLKDLEKEMKELANKWKKAEGTEKESLLSKLKDKLENKCSRNGYVIANSLKILSRSLGKASLGRYVGDYVFYVQLQGDVLNPPDGIVIEGEVISKNKMGLYINYKNAIRVIVPRDLHIGNEEFDSVSVGTSIKVEVKKSRFQVNDESILSVGLFISKTNPAETVKEEDENLVLEDE